MPLEKTLPIHGFEMEKELEILGMMSCRVVDPVFFLGRESTE